MAGFRVANTYDLPSPEEEDGRALLAAAQRLVRGCLRTVDYVDGWEDVARHALRELLGVAAFEQVMVARRRAT